MEVQQYEIQSEYIRSLIGKFKELEDKDIEISRTKNVVSGALSDEIGRLLSHETKKSLERVILMFHIHLVQPKIHSGLLRRYHLLSQDS